MHDTVFTFDKIFTIGCLLPPFANVLVSQADSAASTALRARDRNPGLARIRVELADEAEGDVARLALARELRLVVVEILLHLGVKLGLLRERAGAEAEDHRYYVTQNFTHRDPLWWLVCCSVIRGGGREPFVCTTVSNTEPDSLGVMIRSTLALVLAAAACGHPAVTPAPARPSTGPVAGDPSCPVLVPGTSVTVEDTPTGAALVFVTTGDAMEVRHRVATLAAMHAHHDGPPTAMGMMISTPSMTATSDIAGGAKVTFTAKPDDAGTLEAELRMHAQHLAGGSCEMAMMRVDRRAGRDVRRVRGRLCLALPALAHPANADRRRSADPPAPPATLRPSVRRAIYDDVPAMRSGDAPAHHHGS